MDELGVEDNKRLKCSGHVVLSIDEALDYVFKEIESSVGREKLIGVNVGGAFQSGSSIITLGLIAMAKALSPSHAALSYSLYMQYKVWRSEKGLEVKDTFKGFQSNRIGRIAHLASLFIQHRNDLISFFDEVVDENSNRLVLCLFDYLRSGWFKTGCEIYNDFNNIIIGPLCDILGIDKYGEMKRMDRNWIGVKNFFGLKLKELENLSENPGDKNRDKLLAKCAAKVSENLERQINQVSFFKEGTDEETQRKLAHAPLTN